MNRRLWSCHADAAPPPAASRTGRPRSAAADAAILAATRDALVELGWSRLTLGDVATRAGVAKTTLYRRWAGKNELVVDAVAALFDELELPDRGSLAADIEGVVLAVRGDPGAPGDEERPDGGGRRVHARRRAAGAHPRRRSWTGRNAWSWRAAHRAQQRGELPPEQDPEDTARTVT